MEDLDICRGYPTCVGWRWTSVGANDQCPPQKTFRFSLLFFFNRRADSLPCKLQSTCTMCTFPQSCGISFTSFSSLLSRPVTSYALRLSLGTCYGTFLDMTFSHDCPPSGVVIFRLPLRKVARPWNLPFCLCFSCNSFRIEIQSIASGYFRFLHSTTNGCSSSIVVRKIFSRVVPIVNFFRGCQKIHDLNSATAAALSALIAFLPLKTHFGSANS